VVPHQFRIPHLAVLLDFVHHIVTAQTFSIEPINEHNLAAPDFEPTDEQLQELTKDARKTSMKRLRLNMWCSSASRNVSILLKNRVDDCVK
jgi:hypothetical protein